MAAFYRTFPSIFILCAIFFLSDSNSVPDTRSRVRRAFDVMDEGLVLRLVKFLDTPADLIIDFLDCIEQEAPYLKCNFNFTFDPFYIVKQCYLKDDRLKILFEKINESIPPIKANLAVPPVVSKEVCFGGIPPNLMAGSPDYLDAMPLGSEIAAEAGLFGIYLRDILDVVTSKIYLALRTALSLGTITNVPSM